MPTGEDRRSLRIRRLVAGCVLLLGIVGLWGLFRAPDEEAADATSSGEADTATEDPMLHGRGDAAPRGGKGVRRAAPSQGEPSPAPGVQASRRLVRGRVVDEVGRGIEGIAVLGQGEAALATSDAEGRFEVQLPRKSLWLWPRSDGTWISDGGAYLEAARDEVILRVRRAVRVPGIVLGPEDRPLAGATVIATRSPADLLTSAVSEENGRFELFVPVGLAEMDVYCRAASLPEGAASCATSTSVRVRVETGRELVLRLGRGVRIVGEVLDEEGDPVTRGAIRVRPVGRPALGRFTGSGALLGGKTHRFACENLQAGSYVLTFQPHARDVAVPEPMHVEAPSSGVRVVCPKGLVLKGRVLGADPQSFFVVWMKRMPGRPDELMAAQTERSGPAGSFTFLGTSNGDTMLYAYLPGDDRYALIERPEAPDEEVRMHLRDGRSIEGRIVRSEGPWTAAYATPRVGVMPSYGRMAFNVELDGTFRLTGLPEGTYQLYVTDAMRPNRAWMLLGEPVQAGTTGLLFPLPR